MCGPTEEAGFIEIVNPELALSRKRRSSMPGRRRFLPG
jgi:hypothetical protein